MPADEDHPAAPRFTVTDGPIRFSIGKMGELYLTFQLFNESIGVTAHSIDLYERSGVIPMHALRYINNHRLKVIDVGAGANELITHVHMPMIIDPLPYLIVDRVLSKGYSHAPRGNSQKAIEILRQRIDFITNPNKAYLINMTLEDAYQSHFRELKEWKADIILDVNGASTYGDRGKVHQYELNLLWEPNPERIWSAGNLIGGRFDGRTAESLNLSIRS